MKASLAVSLNIVLSVGGFLALTALGATFVLAFVCFLFVLIPAANKLSAMVTGVDVLKRFYP